MNNDRVGRVEVTVYGQPLKRIGFWVHAADPEPYDLFNRFLLLYNECGLSYLPPLDSTRNELPQPSERLLALLYGFHETLAVMPLVDCLIEEYPELEPYLSGVTCEQ